MGACMPAGGGEGGARAGGLHAGGLHAVGEGGGAARGLHAWGFELQLIYNILLYAYYTCML